jgi:hypothetical protein
VHLKRACPRGCCSRWGWHITLRGGAASAGGGAGRGAFFFGATTSIVGSAGRCSLTAHPLSLPTAVAAQNPEGAKKGCVDAPLAQQTEPPAPPKDKAAGTSGTTGWSGSLGGTNIATEGGGTRDSKQRVPETATGLDPTAKGKVEGKGAPC